MCSIAGGAGRPDAGAVDRMIRRTRHRGPDGTGSWQGRGCVLGHARLAIVDPGGPGQPVADEAGRLQLVANGEIYNHTELRARLASGGHRWRTASDSEALVHLLEEALYEALAGHGVTVSGRGGALPGQEGNGTPVPAPGLARAAAARIGARLQQVRGMYAFGAWWPLDAGGGLLVLARDPLGIRPLYVSGPGRPSAPESAGEEVLYFASEMKALREAVPAYHPFPPGHVGVWVVDGAGRLAGQALVRHYDPPWERRGPASGGETGTGSPSGRTAGDPVGDPMPGARSFVERLLALLDQAVRRRLMADVPVGVLLSGGLDSSLVSALARRHYPGQLHSFAVGSAGSPDLQQAQAVARRLGTCHHERRFDAAAVRRILPAVVYHLESFDAPLVRSAVANYLVFEMASGFVKVALSGEGSDELFAGYAYLEQVPEPELDRELGRLMALLHHTNLQRGDRMGLAHGVEGRVPFLDVDLVEWAFTALPPRLKRPPANGQGRPVDKWIVRMAADSLEELAPTGVAWRPKEKFSAGSGAAPVLRELAGEMLSDSEWARLAARFPDVPLHSREQALYFRLFLDAFPEPAARAAVGLTRSVVPGEVA